jgi:hypothetical protein
MVNLEKLPAEFREHEGIAKEFNNRYPPSPQMLNEVDKFLESASKKEMKELVQGLNEVIKEQCHRSLFFVNYLRENPGMLTYSTSFMDAFSAQAKTFAPYMKQVLKGEDVALELSKEEWGALYEFWKHNFINNTGVKNPSREQVLDYIESLGDTNDVLYQKTTKPLF